MITVCSKIVLAYDGSELSKKALKFAISFLKQDPGIELDVITVVNMRDIVHHSGITLIDIGYLRQEFMLSAQAELQLVEEELRSLPNPVKTLPLEGNPGKTIVEYAAEQQADIVIMGSRGHSGLKELFLGSASHHVAQHASCPVLIVK
ncbi:hypothetical protein BEP19_08490 [Ammoniphilus oxalaticus]|uniref:UspA domain-containing protein n=1 Tax=Ammoniphilus oxalaticus TaxID=66863 RepID=A0A419SKB0_9BACL|nr:universal stress protein [Ammoniphilus oxalaticus]RKD24417.1 hypothetical protein BEP19_08490 [Ammoniphilus oxalaticus]